MKIHNCVLAIVMAAALAACGGGGGSSGTPAFGGGTGGGTDTGTGGGTVTPATYVMQLQLQTSAGVDIASNSFAASDTVKLLATLKTSAGVAVANEVVTFAENGSGLLQFTPTAATALTNASGQAMIEVKAATLTSQGATAVSATATLGGTGYAASRNLQVTGAVGVNPQTLAKSVNFVAAVPADKSIVIAGAGGNGRSETAILSFQVLNDANTPVPGVNVTFETLPVGVVTFNSATGTTDASGVASAAIMSKSLPTTVVVRARVDGTAIEASSDLLTVTTGPAVAGRFSLAANKYVLNSAINLDPATITVAVGDVNGNPVADGFAVVATATRGLIGTSSRGGCTTVDGECTLPYRLQTQTQEGSAAGENILITVSGASTASTLSHSILLYATSVDSINLYPVGGGTIVTTLPTLTFDTSCKAVWNGVLGTANGTAPPAGSTLEVASSNDKVTASVLPLQDSLNGRPAEVELTLALNNATVAGDTVLKFTLRAGDFVRSFNAKADYRACLPPV